MVAEATIFSNVGRAGASMASTVQCETDNFYWLSLQFRGFVNEAAKDKFR
jgi:hypothetical protein